MARSPIESALFHIAADVGLLDSYNRQTREEAAESFERLQAGEPLPPRPVVPVPMQLLALNGFNMVARRLSEFFLFPPKTPYLRATDLVPAWTKEGKPYLEYLSRVIGVYNERVAHYTTKWGTGEGFGWPTALTACVFVESLSSFRSELLASENSHLASAILLPPGADEYCWADTISEWNEFRGEHDFPPGEWGAAFAGRRATPVASVRRSGLLQVQLTVVVTDHAA